MVLSCLSSCYLLIFVIFEAGPFGEAQPEMPCLCLEAGPQGSGWVPDGARPFWPRQSFDVSKCFMHEHIATLVSHGQSFHLRCVCAHRWP